MKLRDVLSKVSINKTNGQLTTCLKKGGLKKAGINETELFNMKLDTKLKKALFKK
jgi:hypothetical protein